MGFTKKQRREQKRQYIRKVLHTKAPKGDREEKQTDPSKELAKNLAKSEADMVPSLKKDNGSDTH